MTVKREKERKKEVNETRAACTASFLFSGKGRKSYISLSINALEAVSGVFEQLFRFFFSVYHHPYIDILHTSLRDISYPLTQFLTSTSVYKNDDGK